MLWGLRSTIASGTLRCRPAKEGSKWQEEQRVFLQYVHASILKVYKAQGSSACLEIPCGAGHQLQTGSLLQHPLL